eukprot:6210372-Pleurochrysis_carterae.AAC.1
MLDPQTNPYGLDCQGYIEEGHCRRCFPERSRINWALKTLFCLDSRSPRHPGPSDFDSCYACSSGCSSKNGV